MIDDPFAEPYMTAEEQDELAPLARLESQNQALQEREQHWIDETAKAREATETYRSALAEAVDEKTALQERAQRAEAALQPALGFVSALQERAEKAEARNEQLEGLKFQYLTEKEHWMTRAQQAETALKRIRDSKHAVPPVDASECRAIARNALSPTQETDPE